MGRARYGALGTGTPQRTRAAYRVIFGAVYSLRKIFRLYSQ